MPPVVAAAAVTAAATLGGAALSSRSNNKASNTQAQSTDKALEFQRQQAAEEKAYRDKQDAAAKAQFEAQQARFAPYWGASLATLGQYNDRVGIPNMSAGDLPQSRAAQSQTPSSSSLYALANPGMGQGMAPKSDYDVSLDSLGAAPIAPAKVTLAEIARRYRSA